MAKTLTEAEKERARANQEYWEKREKAQAAAYQLEENNLEQRILNRYDYLLTEIDARINDFYQRFARAEGITMNLAEMAVSQMDVKAYNTRAAQLVKDRDFSPKANQELRLYNATMRINRLEMLKSRIGLEMLDTYQQLEDEFGTAFRNRCTEEYERQASILGQSTSVMPQKDIERILTADFNNANWSSRLWANQGALRDRLSELLTNGIIQGRSVRALAKDLQELLIKPSANNALRLMRTEMNRVQTETQMASFRDNGYKQYMFISTEDSRTCSQCAHLNGEIFDVDDPKALKPPQHPNCRCSTAAFMDRDKLEREVFEEAVSYRAKNVKNIRELEKISKSPVVSMDSIDDIVLYFDKTYGIEIQDFDGQDLFKVKETLSGFDDFFKEFPEAGKLTKNIMFSPQFEEDGKMSANGFSVVGPSGLDYGTGLHEAAHALDYAISGTELYAFSNVVYINSLRAAGYKSYKQNIDQIIGSVFLDEIQKAKILDDPAEIFAYSLETALGGVNNSFALTVLEMTRKYYG